MTTRTHKPTLATLEGQDDAAKVNLLSLITSVSTDENSAPNEIRMQVSDMKKACNTYETASRALSTWHSNKGSVQAATEVRNCRIEIVHSDAREAIRNLNQVLDSLGEDRMSSIGSVKPSVISRVEGDDKSQHYGSERSAVAPSNRSGSDHHDASSHSFAAPKASEKAKTLTECLSQLSLNTEADMSSNDNTSPEFEDIDHLDPVSRRQLKQDLLRGLEDPFDGSPELFWSWQQQIGRRLLEAEVGSLDSLHILKANTKCRPKQVISRRIAAGSHNPKETLSQVWKDLRKRFGASSSVAESLMSQLNDLPPIKHNNQTQQLEDMLDMCRIILSNMGNCSELNFFNLHRGMKTIWSKLPAGFETKWRKSSNRYEDKRGSAPNFKYFIAQLEEYVSDVSTPASPMLNQRSKSPGRQIRCLRTEVEMRCVYHEVKGHSISSCSAFKKLSYNDKMTVVRDRKLCYGCLGEHRLAECSLDVKCSKCEGRHSELLHREKPPIVESFKEHRQSIPSYSIDAKTNCINICGDAESSRVCSKTLEVVLKTAGSSKELRCICILDEQSNVSFCGPKVPEFFGLSTTSHKVKMEGAIGLTTSMDTQEVKGVMIRGVTENNWIGIPRLITNPFLPDSARREMGTPEIVASHPHIKSFANYFPRPHDEDEVLLLIGADCGQAMQTQSFGCKPPFVHHTALGWALVGPICSQKSASRNVKSLRTSATHVCEHLKVKPAFDSLNKTGMSLDLDVFAENSDDDSPGLSRDDQRFIDLIHSETKVNEKGNIEMPLPLRNDLVLPNNRIAVLQRTKNTLERVKRDTVKLKQCTDIMDKYLKAGHVEQVPPNEVDECKLTNYIPIFPVQNPKKDKIRLVFDSSASYAGISLNDNLIQGPDENNRLVGVLTRFRHGSVGFSADVECMFHSFYVAPVHRNLLRYFWWKENDPRNSLIPFRANVHVFGNCCSPAISTYGIRHAASVDCPDRYKLAKRFIKDNMYVDDALGTSDNTTEAIETLSNAREMLSRFNIRLHKIASNDRNVLEAFSPTELSENVNVIDLVMSSPQKTLGISWNVESDNFILKCDFPKRSITRRGILSTTNSLFDPLGFVSPITLGGRLLQRKILPPKDQKSAETEAYGWDTPLPPAFVSQWEAWTASLSVCTEEISVPRCFSPPKFGTIVRRELHVFSDAAQDAIGFVIYLRLFNSEGHVSVAFVFGSSKVAPRAATTIPRLELCAAVEASQSSRYIRKELGKQVDDIFYYTDSYIVLGYINNTTKCFSKYVTARVQVILKIALPKQWNYVSTKVNPADISSRPHTPHSLLQTKWFTGPDFLWQQDTTNTLPDSFVPAALPEEIPLSKSLRTSVEVCDNVANLVCARTSKWMKAVRITALVHSFCDKMLYKIRKQRSLRSIDGIREIATNTLIQQAQMESHFDTFRHLEQCKPLIESNKLTSLCPFLDDNKVMRVGGRLQKGDLPFIHKHPILLPAKHSITEMILRHYHEENLHQGRHITAGAVQQAGYHILHCHQTLRKFISQCVTCRRLRGPLQTQIMADLPADRLEQCPPFTNTGIDAFGPYLVYDGVNTRRTNATKKVWGLLFTCLVSRAIHVEPLSSLDTPTFRLALRRFLAIRGQCKRIRTDRGSNFIGARNEMSSLDENAIKGTVESCNLVWELTPAAASHTGGVWERKVGSLKKILDAAMLQLRNRSLSRCELHTLFQECAAIVNNTPLYEISSDPNDPTVISPAMLLTLKDHPNPPSAESFNESDLLRYGKQRWKRVSYLSEQFWVRWRQQYLRTLQARSKWSLPKRSTCVGDVVLMREHCPRNSWPVARVTGVETGQDGMVRTVTLLLPATQSGKNRSLRRSVHDTVLLIPHVERATTGGSVT